MSQRYLSRREFVAAGGAAFAAATGLTIEQAMAQKGFRLRGKAGIAGGGEGVLSSSDLTFLGAIRLGTTANVGALADTDAASSVAFRTVGGQTRIFTWGNYGADDTGTGYKDYQLLELALPATAPNTDLASSPQCTLVKNWRYIRTGHVYTSGGVADNTNPANRGIIGGMWWDEARNALWWSYGDPYVPGSIYPSLCCTVLDDVAGTFQTYGPWAVQKPHNNFARGCITSIPASFADAYCPGKTVGIMGGMASGVPQCPMGIDLRAWAPFNPTTKAPQINGDPYSVAVTELVNFKYDTVQANSHQMARDTRYKVCDWQIISPTRQCGTAPVTVGAPTFGGPWAQVATGEGDTVRGGVWVDGTKRGFLWWGALVRTPTGYTAPGDPDGLVHRWYGNRSYVSADPTNNVGHTDGYCCHGQPDPEWGTTGPGAHYRQPMGWIVDPDDLALVASGSLDPWAVNATSFEWKDICPMLDMPAPLTADADQKQNGPLGMSGYLDPTTKRLYLTWKGDTITNSNHLNRPHLLVFQVNY